MSPPLPTTPLCIPTTGIRAQGKSRGAEGTSKILQTNLESVSAEQVGDTGACTESMERFGCVLSCLRHIPYAVGCCPQPCVLATLLLGPECHPYLDLSIQVSLDQLMPGVLVISGYAWGRPK